LFEVCRQRDIPIITFINKMDRESRDPFELLDEIEKTLALDTSPMTWPIGRGRDFVGSYDLVTGHMRLVSGDGKTVKRRPLDLAGLAAKNPIVDVTSISDGRALGKGVCRAFGFQSVADRDVAPGCFWCALKKLVCQ